MIAGHHEKHTTALEATYHHRLCFHVPLPSSSRQAPAVRGRPGTDAGPKHSVDLCGALAPVAGLQSQGPRTAAATVAATGAVAHGSAVALGSPAWKTGLGLGARDGEPMQPICSDPRRLVGMALGGNAGCDRRWLRRRGLLRHSLPRRRLRRSAAAGCGWAHPGQPTRRSLASDDTGAHPTLATPAPDKRCSPRLPRY